MNSGPTAIADEQTVLRKCDRPLADAVTVVMINDVCNALASAVEIA
jgi:hypothetical protein